MKATEHLVDQLKTQIADLERFIQYLQSKYTINYFTGYKLIEFC